MQKRINTSDSPYCLLVIPLLVEKLPHPLVNRILVVDIDPALQQQRAMQRDQADSSQIKAIMAMQASREQRLRQADDIIDNNRDFDHLSKQVKALHQRYLILTQQR